MFRQWLIFCAMTLAVGSAGGRSGLAAEDGFTADPPGVWRKLTWDDATTTSKCIGKPVTPICAVETMLACYMQSRENLCHLAIFGQEDRQFIYSEASPALYTAYRISAVKKVRAGNLVRLLDEVAQPGDVLVDLRDKACEVKSHRCENDIGPPTTHLLRKVGEEWRIITWDTPRW